MTHHHPSLRHSFPGALEALLVLVLIMMAPMPGDARAATVTVAAGDSLSSIASRAGVSVDALARANGIRNPNMVVVGTRLTLPGGGPCTCAPSSAPAAPASSSRVHTVRAGESLGQIAARYAVSVAALAQANAIRDTNVVVVGRRLTIPAAGTATPAATPAPAPSASGTLTVRPGDTLAAIAARHGVSVGALAQANGIANPNALRVGQRLRLPGAGSTPVSAPTSGTYIGPRTVSASSVIATINAACARYGVDPAFARAIAYQESGFNHNVRSHVGAIGAMQLMPTTAGWVGPTLIGRRIDPHNLADNVEGGVAYLAWLQRRTGSPQRAAAAYYQGLNALLTRGMFDDTKAYVASVMTHYGRV